MANGFGLTLDTLAPNGSFGTPVREFTKENFNLTINRDDAQKMKFWFDLEENPSEAPTGLDWIDIASEGSSFEKMTTFTDSTPDGKYYFHAIFKDNVNNASNIISTSGITYDKGAPAVSNVFLKDPTGGSTTITNDRANYFGFAFGDAGLAPIVKAVVSCVDFVNSITINNPVSPYNSEQKNPKEYVTFKPDCEDGPKTITVTITDAAGNESSAIGSITLDTTAGEATIALLKADAPTDPGQLKPEDNLPAKINYTGVKAYLKSTQNDIVGYKLWEVTEPSNYTSFTKGQMNNIYDFSLSSGDATKTVHVKLIDEAGNESTASASVLVDLSAPTFNLTRNNEWIAGTTTEGDTGTTTISTLTISNLDVSISGLYSWSLKVGSTQIAGSIKQGEEVDPVPTTYDIKESSGLVEGANNISLTVTDEAGNSTTKSVIINLDKKKPTLSITPLNTWYNNWDTFSTTFENSDPSAASGILGFYIWTNTVATDTIVPEGSALITTITNPQTVSSNSIIGNPSQTDANYIHIKLVDKVGHFNFAHSQFGYDSAAPTLCVAEFTRTSYSSPSAQITVRNAVDATSGVSQIKITGDVTATGSVTPGTWFNLGFSGDPVDITVTLKENASAGTSELKKVNIYLKDTAGNESGILVKDLTTELDQGTPSAGIQLRNATDSGDQPSPSSVAKFGARIWGYDDGQSGAKAVEYKLYGDFNYGSQQAEGIPEPATWTELTYDTGAQYMTISNMYCTSNAVAETSETKHIYVKVRDEAGNESAVTTASFIYDTSAPTVDISNLNHQIVSKIHSFRQNTSGDIPNDYADEIKFTFTPSEAIQAYKVCAYTDLDNAKWKDVEKTQARDPAEEEAIPTTAGSINMSATGISAATAVNATIKGADYETALIARGLVAGSTAEGAHVVVVYVQDLGGLWSALANFII